MKKLGKKNYEVKETIEAYANNCSGVASCNCDDWYNYVRNNDRIFNIMFNANNR